MFVSCGLPVCQDKVFIMTIKSPWNYSLKCGRSCYGHFMPACYMLRVLVLSFVLSLMEYARYSLCFDLGVSWDWKERVGFRGV